MRHFIKPIASLIIAVEVCGATSRVCFVDGAADCIYGRYLGSQQHTCLWLRCESGCGTVVGQLMLALCGNVVPRPRLVTPVSDSGPKFVSKRHLLVLSKYET